MSTPQADSGMRRALDQLVEHRSLSEEQAYGLAQSMMQGELTPAQIGALLIALRMKGETPDEIAGFTRAMRDQATPVDVGDASVVDTCGTGGDCKGTFNISTVCALVAAGGGARVAKHGNRSVSSRCGSSDLLVAMGVHAEMGADLAARCIREAGIAFLFAPLYHKATRHAVGPRREIGVRSIFNIVGPLTNPAGAKRQLMGVFKADLTEPLAMVLRRLGSEHCLIVHGQDGLDEISTSTTTQVSELRQGNVTTYEIHPEMFGMRRSTIDDIRGGNPATNARIAQQVLAGEPGAARDIVVLNAAAVLYVAGVAPSIRDGVPLAEEAIDSGAAIDRLKSLRALSEQAHA